MLQRIAVDFQLLWKGEGEKTLRKALTMFIMLENHRP